MARFENLKNKVVLLGIDLEMFTCGKRFDPQSNQARPRVVDRGMPSAMKALGVLWSLYGKPTIIVRLSFINLRKSFFKKKIWSFG